MKKTHIAALGLSVLLICLMVGVAGAGSLASYTIDWHVMSGGGAPASAGIISLNGSLGQTAIGFSVSDSGQVKLSAGYWLEARSSKLYLPIILKNRP